MRSRFPIVELEKHVRQVSQRNRADADIEVFSVTNSEGFTRSTDYFSKEVFSKDVSNYKVVRPGQFAYNPSRINVGSIDYLRHNSPVLVSPLYVVFEGDEELQADFLLRYLKSDWGNAQIRANTEGAVRDSLKFKGLESIKIPLPPIDDQIRIAHLLGKVEGLIVQRKQHLQQLDDLIKSVFLEMFGGANQGSDLTIGEAIKQGILLLHKDGNHGSNYPKKEEFGEFGVPFITAKSIDDYGRLIEDSIEHLNEEKASKLTVGWIESGDVLLAHNATVGRVGLYRGEFGRALIGTSLTAFRPNKKCLSSIYLHELLRSHFFQRQLFWGMGQATRNQVPITAQRELFIRVPELSVQDRFAAIFEKVEGIKTRYQQGLIDLETLYGALSQQAFKGELDLSRVRLPDKGPEEEKAVVTARARARPDPGRVTGATQNKVEPIRQTGL